MLLVMCGRKVKKLGGQDRRWIKVSSLLYKKYKVRALINESYINVAAQTELGFTGEYIKLKELDNKYLNYLKLNINVIKHGIGQKQIHYCAHALEMLPSAVFLKFFFRKIISFSFNGVSVNYLKSTNQWKAVTILRVMNFLSDRIEILNPALLQESFFKEEKIFISQAMYAGNRGAPKKTINKKKIVFSGHLYALKGIEILAKLIESCPENGYEFHIYGSKMGGDKSEEIEAWIARLNSFANVYFFNHVDDMSHAYADALVVLSLQTISNYPSQVVMEGLASGAAVLITNTGDSKQFGDIPGIFYVSQKFDEREYWEKIKIAASYSVSNFELIAQSCLDNFNPEIYVSNFYSAMSLEN